MPAAFIQPVAGAHPPPVILVGKVFVGGKSELEEKLTPYEVYRRFYVGIRLRTPKKDIGFYLKDNNHTAIVLLPIV